MLKFLSKGILTSALVCFIALVNPYHAHAQIGCSLQEQQLIRSAINEIIEARDSERVNEILLILDQKLSPNCKEGLQSSTPQPQYPPNSPDYSQPDIYYLPGHDGMYIPNEGACTSSGCIFYD